MQASPESSLPSFYAAATISCPLASVRLILRLFGRLGE